MGASCGCVAARDMGILSRRGAPRSENSSQRTSTCDRVVHLRESEGRAGEKQLITLSEMFSELAAFYSTNVSRPFEFLIVDEAQDVSIAQLRFLAALGKDRANSLFFAGDLGQRIFQQPFSWKALGVDVRGRATTLRIQ